jgi:hypothetical protein
MHQVNDSMYINRTKHEKDLREALKGHRHIILRGDSGCGKTWLYKKLFQTDDIYHIAVNLASAQKTALGSIRAAIKNAIDRDGELSLTEVEEGKSGGLTAPFASAELHNTKKYGVGQKEPYEMALAHIRTKAKKRNAVLVLDNLEMIFSDEAIMQELAGLIILVDDEHYAKYNVKLLLVGTSAGIRDYFSKTPERSSVANRLIEIPEVYRMTEDEAQGLIKRGFEDELNIIIRETQKAKILKYISWVTHRIPQSLHEYCLELAKIGEPVSEVFTEQLQDCDKAWLSDSLSNSYSITEGFMNERETKIGRRNQILYALSKVEAEEFRSTDIEDIVRREFGESTIEKTLNIGGMMSEMATDDSPILRRTPKGDAFMFKDPKFRLCVRAMLRLNPNDKTVFRIPISDLNSSVIK